MHLQFKHGNEAEQIDNMGRFMTIGSIKTCGCGPAWQSEHNEISNLRCFVPNITTQGAPCLINPRQQEESTNGSRMRLLSAERNF